MLSNQLINQLSLLRNVISTEVESNHQLRRRTFRSQPSTRPANSTNNTVQCSNCGTTHPKDRCPAYQLTCFKYNRIGHYSSECRSTNSSSNSTQNTRQFNRFHGRGRTPCGQGFTPRWTLMVFLITVHKLA